jgi:adenylate cyclase
MLSNLNERETVGPGAEVDRAFLIADLSGYTALTEAHGNVEAAKVVARYVELTLAVLEPGVSVVERVGDELVLTSATVVPIAVTAIRLRDAVEAEPRFPRVRSGVHLGRVLEQDGHFYGTALNVTARVAQDARPGQILCTAAVAHALAHDSRFTSRPLGAHRFKNMTVPIEVFELAPDTVGRAMQTVDPVCRMQVDEETAPAKLPWQGRTLYFCSFECARLFAEHPDDYA